MNLREIKGYITIDTGVLIEYLENSALGGIFREKILENEQITGFYISPLVHTELLYIYCRSRGFQEAKIMVSGILKDFITWEEAQLREEAARIKCLCPISIADCYSIALAIAKGTILCVKREQEIEDSLPLIQDLISKKIIFIDDL